MFTGFDGRLSSPIRTDYAGSERWSPDSRVLVLLDWTHATVTFVSIANDDIREPVQRRIPLALDIAPQPDGTRSFDGTFSPDGRHLLLQTVVAGTDPLARAMTMLDVDGAAPRHLAFLPIEDAPTDQFVQPVWAPDGSSVSVVTRHLGVNQVATISTTTGEVRWLGRPADLQPDVDLRIAAVADGSRTAVLAGGDRGARDRGVGPDAARLAL